MPISSYLCIISGQKKDELRGRHPATIRRARAYAIGLHIPVLLWAVSGYLIAAQVFQLAFWHAVGVAIGCSCLIYTVERLVILAPNKGLVILCRSVIGVIIACLGAITIDLVMFDREVTQQLRADARQALVQRMDARIARQREEVDLKQRDWQEKQRAANCEANGTCGTGKGGIGKIYQQLMAQVAHAQKEYDAAYSQLQLLKQEQEDKLAVLGTDPSVTAQAGILARVAALHKFIRGDAGATVAFFLFLFMLLAMEMIVLFVKMAFGETPDDRYEAMQARIKDLRLQEIEKEYRSPVRQARSLVDSTLY